jgi:hypothetical protein
MVGLTAKERRKQFDRRQPFVGIDQGAGQFHRGLDVGGIQEQGFPKMPNRRVVIAR